MADVTLDFIAERLDRIQGDIANLKDDMAVLTAIIRRQDATFSAMLDELRATHSQISRIANRVAKLEEHKS
jgi:septation ring formation regulator EzrA